MDLNIKTIDQSGSWLKYIRGCTKKKVYWLYIVFIALKSLHFNTIAVYLPVEYRFMCRRSFQMEKYVLCIYKCLLFNIPTNNNIYFGELIICNAIIAKMMMTWSAGSRVYHWDGWKMTSPLCWSLLSRAFVSACETHFNFGSDICSQGTLLLQT